MIINNERINLIIDVFRNVAIANHNQVEVQCKRNNTDGCSRELYQTYISKNKYYLRLFRDDNTQFEIHGFLDDLFDINTLLLSNSKNFISTEEIINELSFIAHQLKDKKYLLMWGNL